VRRTHAIFLEQGLEAYCRHPIEEVEREREPLSPGTGFPLVRKLLAPNEVPSIARRVEVILMSRNSADTSLRIFRSLDARACMSHAHADGRHRFPPTCTPSE
jgi:5'-nucleotidase